MLLSLLLTLTPIKPTTLKGFYGRQARAWFLGQIARHDPDLAEEIHDGHGPRPYTVSSLIIPEAGRRGQNGRVNLVPGEECQIRITSLSERLSELLLSKVVTNLPLEMRLKWTKFQELRLSTETVWDDQSSFEKIAQGNGNGHSSSATLEFASPTAFRSGQVDITLPNPDQVWRSLWWRWNQFAPEDYQIDPLWPDFAANCMVVSDFHLRSMKVIFKKGQKGAATGATGQATYRLLPERHCGEYAAFRPGADQVLHTLAEFSLYAGVGHHTTIGLGQTRWLRAR
jgi:CRISPR-associated endoribonuclease Cas6